MSKKQGKYITPLIKISGWYFYIRSWKIHLVTLLMVFLAFRFIFVASEKTIENYRLANFGNLSKGIVTSRMKIGAKGTINIDYKFQVDNIEFSGYTTNENYKIGDSLFIVYLREKPSINRSYSFIKENFKTKINP